MRTSAEGEFVDDRSTPRGLPDDYALMESVAARDTEALGAFYDRHGGLVFTVCWRVLKDRAEAEELLIDVFQELWDRCDRYDPARSSPSTYIVLLARSRAIDRLRARAGDGPSEPLPDNPRAPDSADPSEQVQTDEARARVALALGQLDVGQRELIECSFYEGLSHAEIARRVNRPLGTVKSSIRSGLLKLRDMLREEA